MKRTKQIAVLVLCMGLLIGATSCVVLVKEDNGRHKGWFKNPRNRHNPRHTVYINNLDAGQGKGNHKR
jgi:hypothetical protein